MKSISSIRPGRTEGFAPWILRTLVLLAIAVSATAEPPQTPAARRPLLYFDVENVKLVIKAVQPDGRSLGTVAQGQLAGWSPQGDRFAFATSDEASHTSAVKVMRLGGQPETIFKAGPTERVYLSGWQSIWSPDGKKIALLILLDRPGNGGSPQFILKIVRIDGTAVETTLTLPESVYLRDGGTNWPPYGLSWSPDGRKILLTWERTAIVDIATNRAEIILPDRSMAAWLPTSDGVYFMGAFLERPDLFVKRVAEDQPFKLFDHGQLTDWGMANVVFFHGPLIKLGPGGSRLAVAAGDSVLVFEVDAGRVRTVSKPIRRWRGEGFIVALEWGGTPSELAVLHAAADRLKVSVLNITSGRATTVATLGIQPQGTDIDVVALINTLSWVP